MKFANLIPLACLLSVLIGVLLGSALGYFGQCSSGVCPLTSTWWRGAIYGGLLGLLFHFSGNRQQHVEKAALPRREKLSHGISEER